MPEPSYGAWSILPPVVAIGLALWTRQIVVSLLAGIFVGWLIAAGGDPTLLFVDEIHTVVGAGAIGDGPMDAGNLLKPALARGRLRCIGATTLDEYREHIEKDAALERRFQPIYVEEPSVEDTIAILRGLKARYEAHHGVRIQDGALVAAAGHELLDVAAPDEAVAVRVHEELAPGNIDRSVIQAIKMG